MGKMDRKEILESTIVQNAMKDLGRACRADWTKLGSAHILLTGGTGFFGSWIIVSLVEARRLGLPIEMTVLSRDPDSFLQKNPSLKNLPGLTFRKGDVMNATIPFSITHILHLATGDSDVGNTVVDGTRHMLNEAKRVGVGRFLLASSGAVYGRDHCDSPDEGFLDPSAKLGSAGVSRREAEILCRDAAIAREIETVVARGFTFGGPLFPIDGPYVVSLFMHAILNGLPIQVKTPNAVRSFLDGRDLVTAFWRLLASGKSGEAYNVGSDESVTMTELADLVRAVAWKVSLRVPEIRIAPGVMQGSDIYRPSIAKLRRELGWSPTISLRESLLAHIQWAVESVDNSPGKTYP